MTWFIRTSSWSLIYIPKKWIEHNKWFLDTKAGLDLSIFIFGFSDDLYYYHHVNKKSTDAYLISSILFCEIHDQRFFFHFYIFVNHLWAFIIFKTCNIIITDCFIYTVLPLNTKKNMSFVLIASELYEIWDKLTIWVNIFNRLVLVYKYVILQNEKRRMP